MVQSAAHQTWDGLHIAADDPMGATVVVRRPGHDGVIEYLLLHRNAKGPEFAGDWAWTAPAGCRQPGEAVYPAALRELAEEAGLYGLRPWAVDLSSQRSLRRAWVVFAVDVASDTEVELVDPEHDRFEWVSAADGRRRVRPPIVAAGQFGKVHEVPPATVSFRTMEHDDLPQVVDWQAAPHVARWWHGECATLAEAEHRYGASIAGDDPTRLWVAMLDGRAVGYLQDYRVGDDEAYAAWTGELQAIGFDYLIGEPEVIGRGLGTRMIWEYVRDVLVPGYPEAPTFLASPAEGNGASLRALAKCGFAAGRRIDVPADGRQPATTEIVCTLDRAHWFG
jgi:8-oxo-dGTP pyrophosphatase MutT (NUDIX family)